MDSVSHSHFCSWEVWETRRIISLKQWRLWPPLVLSEFHHLLFLLVLRIHRMRLRERLRESFVLLHQSFLARRLLRFQWEEGAVDAIRWLLLLKQYRIQRTLKHVLTQMPAEWVFLVPNHLCFSFVSCLIKKEIGSEIN